MPQASQNRVDAISRTFSAQSVDSFAAFATGPFDMMVRPWFCSQYYTLPQMWAGMGLAKTAIVTTGVMGWAFDTLYLKRDGAVNYQSSITLFLLLYLGFGIHTWRIARRVRNLWREKFSRSDGEPLPFFKLLPKGTSHAWVRMFWEPFTISAFFTALALLHFTSVFFVLYAYFGAFSLFMRAASVWWEGWQFVREKEDDKEKLRIIEAIVDGEPPPERFGRNVFSSIPASVPPAERRRIIGEMTGLTDEMQKLLSPIDRAA